MSLISSQSRKNDGHWQFAFSSTKTVRAKIIPRVRICVIFNPAARGNKARHFRHHLDDIGGQSALKATSAPGDARRLTAEAVADGFDVIVAAGGDGTVNEVLNGFADSPEGFERARLGVLPLGTVNVFARELNIPPRLDSAWDIVKGGREMKIDLGCADFAAGGIRKRQFFAQLAGAGLDARAIELLDWPLKKKNGPLAYVIAGLKALREKNPVITIRADGQEFRGELVLIGNGRFYGGSYEMFPSANLRDGILDVCIFLRADFPTLLRCLPDFLVRRKLPETMVRRLRAETFQMGCDLPAAFELDGEWAGKLPVTFSVCREKLRVVC